jgi:hypothetical protein
MATTSNVLFYRGAANLTNTVLYTNPKGKRAAITHIAVTNTAGTVATFSIFLGGVAFISGASIPANSVGLFDINQVINAETSISGSASAITVNFHISGTTVV